MTNPPAMVAFGLVAALAAGGLATLPEPATAAPTTAVATAAPDAPSLAAGRGELGELGQILDATYGSLSGRVRPSGYAPTSVNGGYAGMFARDASIQAMAMVAAGEPEKARSVLQYIVGYGTADDLERAPRFLPEERYRETLAVPSTGVDPRSQAQLDDQGSAFRVTGGNRLAQPFVLVDDELRSVHLSPWADRGATGSLEVTVRTERDGTTVAHGSIDAATLPAEEGSGWRDVPLVVDRPDLVQQGTGYVLQLDSARATQRIAVNGSASVVNPPGALQNFENGAWHTPGHTLAFALNERQLPETPRPRDVVASVGGRAVVEQTVSVDDTLGSLDLSLAATPAAQGDVLVSVSDADGYVRSVSVASADVSPDGDWTHLTFPSLGVDGSSVYTVRVSAPQSPPGSVRLLGVDKDGSAGGRLVVEDGAVRTVRHATLGLRAGALETTGESMEDQPDGNYMVVLAWARYVRAFPEDVAFREETYATVARWADYYLGETYWNGGTNPRTGKPMNLLYNPMLEHSRKQVHLRAYDLITNVFASQALHELAEVAREVPGEQDRAAAWASRSALITRGVQDNLVVEREVGGEVRRIYREMYSVADDGAQPEKAGALSAYDGYTWVNLAPVAADWYATDDEIMEATYQGYLQEGSHEWVTAGGGTTTMLNACSSVGPDAGGTCNDAAEVITKGLGWEFALTSRVDPALGAERLAVLQDFVTEKTPDDHLLQESFYPDGRPKDAGNQEQTSWWVLGALTAFPRDAVRPGSPSVTGVSELGGVLAAEPGRWAPADAALGYRWYADGVPVTGAEGAELPLTHDLLGRRISVAVTGRAAGHDTATAWSPPSGPVTVPAGTATDDAALSGMTVDGSAVATFTPERRGYVAKTLAGSGVPVVSATPRASGATITVEPATPSTRTTTLHVTSADASASQEYQVLLEEASAEVSPRCLAGKAYLAVRVTNPAGVPTDVHMSTPFGEMTRTSVTAGTNAYQSFAVRSREVASGELTVTLGTADATTSWSLPFDAVDCGL